ncbi:Uncharacterised protein [Enterobacter hormaechei]|nr:Uncharacterised protein [Enterobacter hormaechei]
MSCVNLSILWLRPVITVHRARSLPETMIWSSSNGGKDAFLILLTPQEQLTGSNTMQPVDQRHSHTGFKKPC